MTTQTNLVVPMKVKSVLFLQLTVKSFLAESILLSKVLILELQGAGTVQGTQ